MSKFSGPHMERRAVLDQRAQSSSKLLCRQRELSASRAIYRNQSDTQLSHLTSGTQLSHFTSGRAITVRGSSSTKILKSPQALADWRGVETKSPEIKLFQVGHVRSTRKVKLALATVDDKARLRRMEQVLQDGSICFAGSLDKNRRFEADVAAMREEALILGAKAKYRQEMLLANEALESKQREADLQAFKNLQEKEQTKAALRIQAQQRGKMARARIAKMKAVSMFIACEEEQDEMTDDGRVDLRKSRYWMPHFMWICDIAQKEGDKINDFMFLADISTEGEITNKAPKRHGRCVFDKVMYDLQGFAPVGHACGKLEFELKFGINTAERTDVPKGWTISFSVCPGSAGAFQGTCKSSWWGTREVSLVPYETLSPEDLSKYPDLLAKYYKSRVSPPTVSAVQWSEESQSLDAKG